MSSSAHTVCHRTDNRPPTTLQKAGMLRYKRGHMVILDRKTLEDTACGCYEVMRTEMQALWAKRRD